LVCTNDGLARFDGYTFTNYDTNEGLPDPIVRIRFELKEDVAVAACGPSEQE